MKTFVTLFLLAAFGAFLLLPVSFIAGWSALFGAGLMSIAVSDYARTHRPLRAAPVRVLAAPQRERFGLAA